MEIWKEIINYSDYQVSNYGRVKSYKRYKEGKILSLGKNSAGYFFINLYKNKKPEKYLIHRLMYEIFNNYKLKDYECVHHINKNKLDNIIDNLIKIDKLNHIRKYHNGSKSYWFGRKHTDKTKEKQSKTRKEKFQYGELNRKGINNPNSKLIKDDIIQIKSDLNNKIPQNIIAKKFNVCRSTISKIKNNKLWK